MLPRMSLTTNVLPSRMLTCRSMCPSDDDRSARRFGSPFVPRGEDALKHLGDGEVSSHADAALHDRRDQVLFAAKDAQYIVERAGELAVLDRALGRDPE